MGGAGMARYLVTGGAGFIGSHIAQALVDLGHEVRVLDNLSTGRIENLRGFRDDVHWLEGDIRERDTVEAAVAGVDYVIHQAALASVPRSIQDPSATNQVNTQGTLNLLESAKRHSVKNFVYASSSSVYGDSDVLPKKETMEANPKSPYAASKLAAEWYCRIFSGIHNLPTVSLRYFNVFGPRQDPDSQYSAVIPIFIKALLTKQRPTIFGDGEQTRDFTYIENVVIANLLACHARNAAGRVYNVACGDRFTLNFLYERLKSIVGTDLDPEFGEPRAGDVRHSQAAITYIEKDLGFSAKIDFEEGLTRTVRWYRETGLAAA
jgi:UDP-glucose 4-epimerase